MSDKQLVTTDPMVDAQKIIQRGNAPKLADLMVQYHPAFALMTEQGMNESQAQQAIQAAAFIAVAMGANPFNGDLHVWVQKVGKKHQLQTTPHYRFMQQFANKIDTTFVVRQRGQVQDYRLMSAEERAAHGLNEGDVGVAVTICRRSHLLDLREMGYSIGDAEQRAARTGYGIVSIDEMVAQDDVIMRKGERGWYVDRKAKHTDKGVFVKQRKGDRIAPPNGRSWVWRAKNRAWRDAISQVGLYPTSEQLVESVRERITATAAVERNVEKESIEEMIASLHGERQERKAKAKEPDVVEGQFSDVSADSSSESSMDDAEPDIDDEIEFIEGEPIDDDPESDDPEADALAARALTTFAKAVFRTEWGSLAFDDVETVEATVKYLCQNEPFTGVENKVALGAIRKCASALNDKASRSEAAAAGRKYFDENHEPIPF